MAGGAEAREKVTATAASKQVVFAQVVHRHGARTPTDINGDHQWACGSLGCGILTPEGEDMLHKLGLWARARYMLFPNATQSDTAYIVNYSYYYPKKIRSRSTDDTRTLQSAAAFIQGLFDFHQSSWYSAVASVDVHTDTLLALDALPAYQVYKKVYNHHLKKHFNENYLLPTLGANIWVALGDEFRLSACAAAVTDFTDCFKEVYDIAESYYSSGLLDEKVYPVAAKHWQTIRKLMVDFRKVYMVYNGDKHTDIHRGPLGRNIVHEILHQFKHFVEDSEKADLREYSTDDSEMVVLADTLGQATETYLLPAFGAAFWFELLLDSTSGNFFIRIIYGTPLQAPGNHTFQWHYFNTTCTQSDGTVYTAFEEGCPLDDFKRWFDSQAGSSSEGYCYIRSEVRTAIDCDATSDSSAPTDSTCAFYRQSCPQYACPSGSYLEFPNLNCHPFPTGSGSSA
jgi:hypothetical protein